jgi:hypothetical protein
MKVRVLENNKWRIPIVTQLAQEAESLTQAISALTSADLTIEKLETWDSKPRLGDYAAADSEICAMAVANALR